MKLKLSKTPKEPIVIVGFPGFGLIGTITTEFLIEHLSCELIGKYWFEDLPATVAIHEQKIIEPIGFYYNKDNNILIIHSISGAQGIEWKAAELVLDVAKQVKAKQVLCLEGVGSTAEKEETDVYYYSNSETLKKKLGGIELKPLKEGIIMGVCSALMLKAEMRFSSIFAETHSSLPDSKAAAKIIEVLDKYLGLKVDYEPLLKQAEKFEEKVKGVLEKSSKAEEDKQKKSLSYVG